MTNKDKIIAAFLVSVGLFSASQAVQYVRALSEQDKMILMPAAKGSAGNVFLCSGSAMNEAIVETNNGSKA